MSARQVDDRQSPHSERDLVPHQRALIIWAAMGNDATHPLEQSARFARVALLVAAYKSGDATHLVSSSDHLSINESHAV